MLVFELRRSELMYKQSLMKLLKTDLTVSILSLRNLYDAYRIWTR